MTTPLLTPATLTAARWLAGLTADSLAGVDDQASTAGVRAIEGGNALELDGQPVYTGDLAAGALLLGRILVREAGPPVGPHAARGRPGPRRRARPSRPAGGTVTGPPSLTGRVEALPLAELGRGREDRRSVEAFERQLWEETDRSLRQDPSRWAWTSTQRGRQA